MLCPYVTRFVLIFCCLHFGYFPADTGILKVSYDGDLFTGNIVVESDGRADFFLRRKGYREYKVFI